MLGGIYGYITAKGIGYEQVGLSHEKVLERWEIWRIVTGRCHPTAVGPYLLWPYMGPSSCLQRLVTTVQSPLYTMHWIYTGKRQKHISSS